MKGLDQLRQAMRRDQVFDFANPMLRAVKRGEVDISHGTILYLEDVTVSFDGFKAINKLNLYINNGELRSIIGPNGAGKSTMMDVITGKVRPDEGTVFYGQTIDLTKLSEAEIAMIGIGRKFQKPTVFPDHSVYENLELATHSPRGVWHNLKASLSAEQRDLIDDTLKTIMLSDCTYLKAGQLSHGQKQWLEIGMLLMQQPRLMLVDEPIAGMTHQETEKTAELLTGLAGERSVIVVEHDMEFVRSLNAKVTVLHEGSVLAEGSLEQVQNNEQVIQVYLGE